MTTQTFFESKERQEALDAAATAWAGTPFRHNSGIRGVGANCVMAIVGVLADSGFKVPKFDMVPASWSRHQTRSAMEDFADNHPEMFAPVVTLTDPKDFNFERLLPGDLVGFKVGLCIHHLGVILPGGRFFQCNESLGAAILSCAERQFVLRFSRAWRPLELCANSRA